jgi:23S rRNA pseudouridine2605 synthase
LKGRTAPARGRLPRGKKASADAPTREPERLQKALARAGLGSRREVEAWIRAGRLTVNGVKAVLGQRVGAQDQLRLDGRLIRQQLPSAGAPVFICHRSPGEPLRPPEQGEAAGPDAAAASVVERLPRRAGRRFIAISPMPRADGGLELLTADGDRAVTLQRAMRQLDVEFSVRIHGTLSEQGLQRLAAGELDDGRTLQITECSAAGGEGSNRWYSLVTRGASGKEVRQLFERQGALVSRVLRTRLGSLVLDRDMPRGRFRELSAEELQNLRAAAGGESR